MKALFRKVTAHRTGADVGEEQLLDMSCILSLTTIEGKFGMTDIAGVEFTRAAGNRGTVVVVRGLLNDLVVISRDRTARDSEKMSNLGEGFGFARGRVHEVTDTGNFGGSTDNHGVKDDERVSPRRNEVKQSVVIVSES